MKNTKYKIKSDKDTAFKLQMLSREQMKLRLLQDIMIDISVCKLEGFDYREYLLDLKREIDRFLNMSEGEHDS